MGKTEKGAIFLDPALTSPYEFYQYWRNVTDEDVVKFLKLFTFLPVEEIDGFASCRDARINQAKELLAYEQTRIIHGREEAEKARRAARAAFDRGAGVPQSAAEKEGIPGITVSRAELEQGIGAVDLFARTSLCSSRAEVRRLITGGGAAAGNRKIDSIEAVIDLSDLVDGEILLKAGKKRCFRVMVE
jgi:tyrosyl-tRNA synthetase